MEKLKENIKKACLKEISRVYGEMIHAYGENQQSLADLLDVNQGTISRYESGKSSINIARLLILEKYLNIDESNYWDFYEEKRTYLDSLLSLYLAIHSADCVNQLTTLIEEFNVQYNTTLIKSPWLLLANVQSYWIERLSSEDGNATMGYVYLTLILSLIAIIITEAIKTMM